MFIQRGIGACQGTAAPLPFLMLSYLPENEVTELVIGKAIQVHRVLGPGLLEKTYEQCLAYELTSCGCNVEQQKRLPLVYGNLELTDAYRIDLLVNDSVIVELKTVEAITGLHAAQLLTYLKFSEKRIGLVLNFNALVLRDGIRRVINTQKNSVFSDNPQRSPTIISP